VEAIGTSTSGALIFLAVYAARPLVLFPASVLTVAAGFLFGPVLGIVLVVIGSNASATVAYLVGRFFGRGLLSGSEGAGLAGRYARRLRDNSFETVLTMRFVFLPYDFVNYLSGFLRINWFPFILATALGSIPGTVAFVLFGASFETEFAAGSMGLDWRVLAASAAIFAASIALSRSFKRRERRRRASGGEPGGAAERDAEVDAAERGGA
jgi:uncharacterized membrane protein YdjX (TVP38/TMEM64 family)